MSAKLFGNRIEEPPIDLPPVEIKALARHRDGYQCVDCGMTAEDHIERFGRNLDVHRIVPGSAYTLLGVQTLCRTCHEKKPKSARGIRIVPIGELSFSLPADLASRLDKAAGMLATDVSHLLRMMIAEKLPEYEQRGRTARGVTNCEDD
jgi:hypothetical protein